MVQVARGYACGGPGTYIADSDDFVGSLLRRRAFASRVNIGLCADFDFEDIDDENLVLASAFFRWLRRRGRSALSDEARSALFLVSHLARPAGGAGGGLEAH